MEYAFFSASGVFILTALAQLVVRNKRQIHYFAALALTSLSYALFYFGAVEAGFISRVPALYYSDISISFLIGPSVYFFILHMLSGKARPARSYLGHFILPVIIFTGLLFYNGLRAFHSPGFVFHPEDRFANPVLFLFSLSGDLYMFFYNTLTAIRGISLRRKGRIKKIIPYRIVMGIVFLYQATILIMLTNYIIRDERIFMGGSIACGLIVLVFSFISIHLVEYKSGIHDITSYPGEGGHELWDDELEVVLKSIRLQLEEKRHYNIPTYQIKNLARDLGKPVAQVSYTVNRGLRKPFKSYLNGLRLDAIARELIEKPQDSILEIAVNNGFNSKSSFNTLFRERFDMSPREFRKRNAPVREG